MHTSVIFNLAVDTLRQYGLLERFWRVEWDNGKRRAGACHYDRRVISLSRIILSNASDEDVRETILHEVAHALTPGHSHDAVWRAKLIEMGGTGKRTHSMETPKGRYELLCEQCGVVGHRHQAQGRMRVLISDQFRDTLYTHVGCGGRLRLNDTAARVPVAAAKPSETPAKPASNPARVCHCGCNGTTKGGAYLPGHDARHVSEVFAAWIANRYDVDGAKHVLRHAPKLQAKLEARIAAYTAKHYKEV